MVATQFHLVSRKKNYRINNKVPILTDEQAVFLVSHAVNYLATQTGKIKFKLKGQYLDKCVYDSRTHRLKA